MRITQAGVYVLIQKYGIEGLLIEDNAEGPVTCSKITADVPNEEAQLTVTTDGKTSLRKVTLFDHLTVEVKAELVEFRRSLNLHYRACLNVNTMAAGTPAKAAQTDGDLDFTGAVKSKKKGSKRK